MTSTVATVTTSPRIVTLPAFKGGVGKTTLTANMAITFAAAHATLRGLVIDLDPQSNLTDGFDTLIEERGPATTDDLLQAVMDNPDIRIQPDDTTRLLVAGHLDLLPATSRLWDMEKRVASHPAQHRLLGLLLAASDSYDFILIDTPPSKGVLTQSAICVSTHIFAVLDASDEWSAKGAREVEGFVKEQAAYGLTRAQFGGVVVNQHIGGTRLVQTQVITNAEEDGMRLLRPFIPARITAKEAAFMGSPAVLYQPRSDLAVALSQLGDVLWNATEANKTAEGVA